LATDVPPNFMTRRPMASDAFLEGLRVRDLRGNGGAPAKRRVYIAVRFGASNRVPV
jgi:hypothetical protein